jgi:hypothetical protein
MTRPSLVSSFQVRAWGLSSGLGLQFEVAFIVGLETGVTLQNDNILLLALRYRLLDNLEALVVLG